MSLTSEEIEKQRQIYLTEFKKDVTTPDYSFDYSFLNHEALHTSWILYSMFKEHLLATPGIFRDPDLFNEAVKVCEDLYELYLKIYNMAYAPMKGQK
jgi:hypothetical protein